jgi:hypothetical protein
MEIKRGRGRPKKIISPTQIDDNEALKEAYILIKKASLILDGVYNKNKQEWLEPISWDVRQNVANINHYIKKNPL